MLVVPLPQPVPTRGPTSIPARAAKMSTPAKKDAPALLWVNKDASNLHSKKHVAEVNAHVQKRGSRGQAAKRSVRKSTSTSRDSNTRRRKSESPSVSSYHGSPQRSFSHAQQELLLEMSTPPPRDRLDAPLHPTLIPRARSPEDPALYDSTSLGIIAQLAHAQDHFSQRIPGFVDIAMTLPTTLTSLSHHDQMLVKTCMAPVLSSVAPTLTDIDGDLSYVPDTLYGVMDSSVYCPIRYASVASMSSDPLGLLWVLIALDMFLAKARGDMEHTELILQRKDEAYQLMANRMNNPRDTQSLGFIIGTASAATVELYFGDSSTALMHLGAIDAVLQPQGTNTVIARLPPSVSIPLLTAFAYRSLLQDNLLSAATFDLARTQFMDTLRSLHLRDQDIRFATPRDHDNFFMLPQEVGFQGMLHADDALLQLRQAKQRAFGPGSVLSKFIDPDFLCKKPSDNIDHFLFLYNINVALHDLSLRGDYRGAARFLDDLLQDVNTAHATTALDSSLKISGVRCLFISRHAKTFARDASEGVARAWQAIDALEILKLVSVDSKKRVYHTLSAMLTLDETKLMPIGAIDDMDIEASTTWWTTLGLGELSEA